MSTINIDNASAWKLLLRLRQCNREAQASLQPLGIGIDAQGKLQWLHSRDPSALIALDENGDWRVCQSISAVVAQLFDLYLPLCLSRQPFTIAHLGQSLDGRIATINGASCYVTGFENIRHLHRMRALSDAVVVGAETVRQDNPRLTTRHVTGDNPVRVILDPQRRLHEDFHVFYDAAAPTLVFCDQRLINFSKEWLGQAEIIGVPGEDGKLVLTMVLERLHERGLLTVFVEGGGITVSHFLSQGLLDRLQVTVAPIIIGSGRPGITLAEIDDLTHALRPRHRHFKMGDDILFDCLLR